jgi:outer membrane receptor protein involved in Fe transport
MGLTFFQTLCAQETTPTAKQVFQITGKIVDASNKQGLGFATVAVWQGEVGKDGGQIGGTNTSETGEFKLENVPAGEVKLHVSYVGFAEKIQTVQLSKNTDLGTIFLAFDSKMLKEVLVSAEKKGMTMSMEKRVFNVDKNITTTGGTAESLLRNVPSLTIDADGTAKLRNVATTIYVNGKPTQLSLAQIPANQIESVEVMTNPSAKYDASAASGIVNLVIRKNRKPGYNGVVSAGYGSNSRFDGTLSLDFNRGKWNFSGLYNANSTKNPLNNYTDRTSRLADGTTLGYYHQNTQIRLDNIFQNGRVAIDFSPSKQMTFTLAGNYVKGRFNSITSQEYQNFDASHNVSTYGQRSTLPQNSFTNTGLELDWRYQFPEKGRVLSFVSSFNRNQVSNAADWQTTYLNAAGVTQPNYPEVDKIQGRTLGNQYLAQLDYTKPVNDSTKWEMGLRSFTYVRDQQYFFNQFSEAAGSFKLLPGYSQNANITEAVNAAYILYTTKLQHDISIQAGLRLEQSSLKGVSRFEPVTTFGYHFPSSDGKKWIKMFFPSFAISKKLSEESSIGINLSRKIGRPRWQQIFIGIQSNDRQNITIGNPALQPEFVNTAELNYDKSWGSTHLLSTLYYIYEDNTIKPTVQPSATDPSILVTTFTNVIADIRAGFDNTLTFSVGKNFNVLANFNFFNTVLQTDVSKRTLWSYNAKLNLTYKLPNNFTVQLNTNNDSRFPQLQGYRGPIRAADFAIRKSFMQNKASVVFTLNDIFNSRRQFNYYDQPTAYQVTMSRRDIRYYKLTLQLPLGNLDNSRKKRDAKLGRPDIDFGNN